MWRTTVGALGLLLALFAARETSARPVCKARIEHLDVTVEEVRIDGVLATKQASLGRFAVDGGASVGTTSGVVFLQDGLQPGCGAVASRTFVMGVVDPFTDEEVHVTFEVAP